MAGNNEPTLSDSTIKLKEKSCKNAVAARAVEAGDIVLDEGDEEADEHGSICEPWRIDPNNGSQLDGEDQEVESADDGDASSQSGFVKQPAGDRV